MSATIIKVNIPFLCESYYIYILVRNDLSIDIEYIIALGGRMRKFRKLK